MSPAHYLAMAFDAGLLLSLIGMLPQISEAPQMESHPGFTRALLACGALSGIGLLVIRFTSDQAWWTGHWRSSL
jgi:hypothetical protein